MGISRKTQTQTQAEAKVKASNHGQNEAIERPVGNAYTELPRSPESINNSKNKFFNYFLIATIIAGSGLFTKRYFDRTASNRNPAALTAIDEKERQTLTVTQLDYDHKTTEEMKSLINSGEKPFNLIKVTRTQNTDVAKNQILSGNKAVQPQSRSLDNNANFQKAPTGTSSLQPQPSLTNNSITSHTTNLISEEDEKEIERQKVIQSLQQFPAAPSIIEQIKKNEIKYYSFVVFDSAAQDGDIVQILLDGEPVGYVDMITDGTIVSIPLDDRSNHVISVKGVWDGGGGITFGAVMHTSKILLKYMSVGEIKEIDVRFAK